MRRGERVLRTATKEKREDREQTHGITEKAAANAPRNILLQYSGTKREHFPRTYVQSGAMALVVLRRCVVGRRRNIIIELTF